MAPRGLVCETTIFEKGIPMADAPKITAFLKPVCGWSAGIREVFTKYDLAYEDKDIINTPENYAEQFMRIFEVLGVPINRRNW